VIAMEPRACGSDVDLRQQVRLFDKLPRPADINADYLGNLKSPVELVVCRAAVAEG